MITAGKIGSIRQEANRRAARLSYEERTRLAEIVLTLGLIKETTLDAPYLAEVLTLLYDLAPSLTTELRLALTMADALNKRTQ